MIRGRSCLLVPGGVVAATLIGTDLAPDVVIAGLEQITRGIKQNGIPNEKLSKPSPFVRPLPSASRRNRWRRNSGAGWAVPAAKS